MTGMKLGLVVGARDNSDTSKTPPLLVPGSFCMFVFWNSFPPYPGKYDHKYLPSCGSQHCQQSGTSAFSPKHLFWSFPSKRLSYTSMLLYLLYHISIHLSILLFINASFRNPFQSKLQTSVLPPKYFSMHAYHQLRVHYLLTFFLLM